MCSFDGKLHIVARVQVVLGDSNKALARPFLISAIRCSRVTAPLLACLARTTRLATICVAIGQAVFNQGLGEQLTGVLGVIHRNLAWVVLFGGLSSCHLDLTGHFYADGPEKFCSD